ncbi:MAG TPA: hypothetical protein EYP46_03860, partial [Hadesarchaea archaeon]|nr:hypothetical protein [Hadesarchaea archaeon]
MSKRLIAKAVAVLPEVKKAFKDGIIIIGLGTTNARVAEEILGRKIERERFAAGVILPKGTCAVPRDKRIHEIVIREGKVINARVDEVLKDLTSKDVIIKGANAIDAVGTAGIFLASRNGGTIGRTLGTIKSRGVNLVVPAGLEKFIPGSVLEVSRRAGIFRFDYATGCPVGVMPVSGKVITELNAIRILTGAEAVVMGMGGVSGAQGSATLLIGGSDAQIRAVRKLLEKVKNEPETRIET